MEHLTTLHIVTAYLGVLIGGVTFTGSIVAFMKLAGKMASRPLVLPARHLINGSLMGAYLSSDAAERFLDGAFDRPLFWLGVGMWAVGFVGNFVHDEILLDIRRKAKAKGKGKADGELDCEM